MTTEATETTERTLDPGLHTLVARTEAWLQLVSFGPHDVPGGAVSLVRELLREVVTLRQEPAEPVAPLVEAARAEVCDELVAAFRGKSRAARLRICLAETPEEAARWSEMARQYARTADTIARWFQRGPAPATYPVALAIIERELGAEATAGEACNFHGDDAGVDLHQYAYEKLSRVARLLGREIPVAEERFTDDLLGSTDGR